MVLDVFLTVGWTFKAVSHYRKCAQSLQSGGLWLGCASSQLLLNALHSPPAVYL